MPAVYSDEARVVSEENSGQVAGGGLNCAGYGSVAHVTAGIGFAAAGKVLSILTV